jgi:hypothetical protein
MWNSTFQRKAPLKRSRTGKSQGLGHKVATALGLLKSVERKPSSLFRSRRHRMNVAALSCICCGREKRSQAAHLNLLVAGKGMGLKASDALVVALCCDDLGRRGCHHLLDQGGVYDKATSTSLQIKWLQETRDMLRKLGQWPDAAEADMQRLIGDYLRRQA